MKTIWRKNFDIKKVGFNLAYEVMIGFNEFIAKTTRVKPINQGIWVIKNLDNIGTYFPKDQLRAAVDLTMKRIKEDPGHIDKIHRKATELNWQLMRMGEKIRKLDLKLLSGRELVSWHKTYYALLQTSHMWAIATTWFLDSDGEDYTHFLMDLVSRRKDATGAKTDVATAFSILTTPSEKSFAQIEEEESLRLLAQFRHSKIVKKWFVSHTTAELLGTLDSLPERFRKKIIGHHYKWCWAPYTYLGPAYELDYYLEVWRGLLHEDIEPLKEISDKRKKQSAIQRQRAALLKELKLTAREKHWFDIAADIVWIKGFRKDCFFHACFVLSKILAEIGRRNGLCELQMEYIIPPEFPEVLAGKDYKKIANDRMKYCLLYSRGRKVKVYSGVAARNFLAKQTFEKIHIKQTNEMKGTCACPGKASGVVRIVNVPAEIPKMKDGDIMLAHTTFPALVPAMKRAAAIITEDGGITCHAAIVARELQTPCIVGVKNALSVFADGDRVEVDAGSGVIKKV